MECEVKENGRCYSEPAVQAVRARARALKRKLGGGDGGNVRLDVAAAVRRPPAARSRRHLLGTARRPPAAPAPSQLATPPTPAPPRACVPNVPPHPFMSNMDEISYWIYTKRAPCLMNYDNVVKNQSEEATCPKFIPESIHGTIEETLSPKKRRKLAILNDDSSSPGKQLNVYFEESQVDRRIVMSSCKSRTPDSEIDFDIKNPSIQDKPRKIKFERSNQKTLLHKKNKVLVTSTPKVTTALRRSLRKAQSSLNNTSQLNISSEAHISVVTGSSPIKLVEKRHKSTENFAKEHDQSVQCNRSTDVKGKLTNQTINNGQFEDVSDVSGFTANYIRSTKMRYTRTSRNLRSNGKRNFIKESQQDHKRDKDTMLVCVNKSVNTTAEPVSPNAAGLNYSTDSSQNIINCVTVGKSDKCNGVNQSTSVLKFMGTKIPVDNDHALNLKINETNKQKHKTNLNIALQTVDTGTSRYPKRHRNNFKEDITVIGSNRMDQSFSIDKLKLKRNSNKYQKLVQKDLQESSVPRTRKRQSISVRQKPENTVLVLSNLSEQMSSLVCVNVAGVPGQEQPPSSARKTRTPGHKQVRLHVKKSMDKSEQSVRQDTLKDRTGFAACVLDSDDDSEPLKQRKYFC